MRDILIWVVTVEVLGVVSLPILRSFFGNRRDAALLARPIGLALVAYSGWAFTLLFSGAFDRGTLFLALGAVAGVSLLTRRRLRAAAGTIEPLWGTEEKQAAILFWAPTGIFLVIRAAVPEILGAEKFMDLAFFNSLTRHVAMPPVDPWMAGKTINYYYWGYLLAAVLAKISGVTTEVAYNLTVATFAGYSFVVAACLGMRLSGGRFAAGLWGGFATVFAGNMQGAVDAWNTPFAKGFDYWHASRVIGIDPTTHDYRTINEFPFFTFFHADLHPHLLAFPFFVAAFALGHRVLETSRETGAERPPPAPRALPWQRVAASAARWSSTLLFSLVAGTAIAGNPWNTPAIAILILFVCVAPSIAGLGPRDLGKTAGGVIAGGLALVVAYGILQAVLSAFFPAWAAGPWPAVCVVVTATYLYPRVPDLLVKRSPFRESLEGGLLAIVTFAAALLLFHAYDASYSLLTNRPAGERGLAQTTMKSGLLEFLGVWGILFAVGYATLLPGRLPGSEDDERQRRRRDLAIATVADVALLAALLAKAPVLLWIFPLAWVAARAGASAIRRPDRDDRALFTAFLLLLSLAMIAGCEFIYFKDSYGHAMQRMNTIFKFYHQAWPLLAVPVAVAAERAWNQSGATGVPTRIALSAAVVLALLYPVNAAVSRVRQREGPFSLDARTALGRRNPGDAAAIDWLEKSAPKNSVVMEATGDPYSEYARISSHTGIPTVLGWANHEGLWRGNAEREVPDRVNQIGTFYTTSDVSSALSVLQKYRVTYVVVGDLERRSYRVGDNIASLPFLVPVLEGGTTVYQVLAAP